MDSGEVSSKITLLFREKGFAGTPGSWIYQHGLEKSQGDPDWELPVPAAYVVAKDGRTIYAFVAPDYTHRADPEDILKALK